MTSNSQYQTIAAALSASSSLLAACQKDQRLLAGIADAGACCANALKKGHKLISCGNGGSHCDAMHFAEELTGRFRANRQPYAALSISDSAHISCVGNDYGFEDIYARYIEALGQTGDVLVAFSTSGQSPNIRKALQAANAKGMQRILLTSTQFQQLSLVDIALCIPHKGYADRIQEMHIKLVHILIQLIESAISQDTNKPNDP